MSSPQQSPRRVKFGDYELNFETAELRNNGSKITIPAQPFQVLLALLHRPGALVTREELRRQLWTSDTFVDFDQSLNKSVNRLREALGDSAEDPRFIKTLPKRGYRFIGDVEAVYDPFPEQKNDEPTVDDPLLQEKPTVLAPPDRRRFSGVKISIIFAILMSLLGVWVYSWIRRPSPVPRIVRIVRITNDGWRKFSLLGDGVRLYFSERGAIFQTSVEGGETTELRTGLSDIDLYDISRGGSELLAGSGVLASETDERPIWIVSLPGGTPRRIGSIKGRSASWAPDGEHVVYATTNAIYLTKKDGSDVRKLADTPVLPWKPQFSPDGAHLRFDGYNSARNIDSIWELDLREKQITQLFPRWNTPQHSGNWTTDGRYFFFNTHNPVKDRDEDVWVLPESGVRKEAVVQLTRGPLAFGCPFLSPEGNRLFVLGTQSRAELARYDSREKQFLPYMKGISASEAEISRDGNWVAYVSYPDLTLWRSRLDGTEKVQLTSPPIEVVGPRWSPDGTRIAFTDLQAGKVWKVYTISIGGGIPEEIFPGDTTAERDPSWWPDGRSIIFGRSYFSGKGEILRIDLTSHQVSSVPGSERIFSPRLSPDGRRIAAFSEQDRKLMLYDFQTRKWREAAHGIFGFNSWSYNGKSIYLVDVTGEGEIVRFDLDHSNLVKIASLKGIEQGSRGWVGLARDDSPLLVLDKSVSDVYRLDLQIP
jgi:Tol biopolymer transport system component/DNA-binding winged helix-turn-helix (wHTH) protein